MTSSATGVTNRWREDSYTKRARQKRQDRSPPTHFLIGQAGLWDYKHKPLALKRVGEAGSLPVKSDIREAVEQELTRRERQTDFSMEIRDFKRDTLNAHNNFRTLHGCPPLAMSEELTNTAQAWADKLADRGILQYSENPNVGENICLIDLNHLPSLKGEHVVKEWYKEIDNYNYNDPGWKKGSYRVSQLLWKATSEIGIGVGKIPGQNRAYVVVNYRPAGNNNMPGEFERNVLPPQKRRDDNVPPWKRRP